MPRLLVVASFLVLLGACKPKVGDSCKPDTAEVCVDDKQALVCQAGAWASIACKGPLGCAASRCDQRSVEVGDRCAVPSSFACSVDGKATLECRDTAWTSSQKCLGEGGCTMDGQTLRCDNTIANDGDACADDADSACTPDGASALVCRGKQFSVATRCRGKRGCHVTKVEGKVVIDCDDQVAVVGDPCQKEGHFACAEDERSLLKCVAKRYAQDDRCGARDRCMVRGELVGCYAPP